MTATYTEILAQLDARIAELDARWHAANAAGDTDYALQLDGAYIELCNLRTELAIEICARD